jgi:hypothetical protein
MMQRRRRWMVVALVATGLALSGCAKTSEDKASGEEPATLQAVPGSDLQRVALTARAAERLGIAMTAVTEDVVAGSATPLKVIPYASVVYDAEGATWAYTSPKPLTFVRTPVTVANIAGERAFLSAGPDTGTKVVTVGTAELFGSEQEIGH